MKKEKELKKVFEIFFVKEDKETINWILRLFTGRKYRHVVTIDITSIVVGDKQMVENIRVFDVRAGSIGDRYLFTDIKKDYEFLKATAKNSLIVKIYKAQKEKTYFLPPVVLFESCVKVSMRLLGIRNFFVHTPSQLYNFLLKKSGDKNYNFEVEKTGET